MVAKPELKRPSTNAQLSNYLNATVYDVSSFGGVPELIDHKIKLGTHDESFLVTDLTCVVEQFDQWQTLLPMVEPFYAVKCNPDPVIIKLLAALGCGFDCATKGEIDLVLNGLGDDLSFGPRKNTDKIVYANPQKMKSHIAFAAENGVCRTVFDGEDELYKLAEINKTLPDG
jgi:ornithine decarboxylase